MKREVLLQSKVFRCLSAEEICTLLCCVAARYEELENNRRFLLGGDELAVSLFGELSFGARRVAGGEVAAGEGMLHAQTQAGFLVINRPRLCALCKNACRCHRLALVNFADFFR